MIEKLLNDTYADCLGGLDILENKTSIILNKIIIKDECRGNGIGSEILDNLVRYADSNNQIVALTPSSDFGSNKNRLIQFYKRFGFKPNKGNYKSYEFMQNMIRYPKLNEDEIKGGLADKMSPSDIANKFDVPLDKVEKEIEMGIEVEMEHVNDKDKAKEIAMDHLVEFPDYYTRLKKMEKEADKEWEGKLNESINDFIKRRIREDINLNVTDETPLTTAYNIFNDGDFVGVIELGKFNKSLGENELEIVFIKINEEFKKRNMGREAINKLWTQLPNINKLILMPTKESLGFWQKLGAKPSDKSGYYEIVRPT